MYAFYNTVVFSLSASIKQVVRCMPSETLLYFLTVKKVDRCMLSNSLLHALSVNR